MGEFCPLAPHLGDRILPVILKPVILLDREKIFRRSDAKLSQPFGIDVQPPRRLAHSLAVDFLSFFAQEPVDEQLKGIGVRCIFDN